MHDRESNIYRNTKPQTGCTDDYFRLIQGIGLLNEENYDCQAVNVWSYRKSDDVRDGINLRFGNMCNGYPFIIAGVHFHNLAAARILRVA